MRKKTKPSGIVGTPTLNGKPIKITDSWEKTTLAQYLRIMRMKNDTIELLSIITGLDYDYLKKAKINGLDKLLYAARFINTPQVVPDKPTKIGGFKLPLNSKGVFDIQFESLAQFEDMRVIFDKLPDLPLELLGKIVKGTITREDLMAYPDLFDRILQHLEAFPKYCALYLQKLRDGEYNGDKALAMVDEVMTYPALEVISAGSFFLVRLWSLLRGTPTTSQSSKPPRKTRIGKPSRKSSVRTGR